MKTKRIKITYPPKPRRKLIERLNTPWLTLATFLGVLALWHASQAKYDVYGNDREQVKKFYEEILAEKPLSEMTNNEKLLWLYEGD